MRVAVSALMLTFLVSISAGAILYTFVTGLIGSIITNIPSVHTEPLVLNSAYIKHNFNTTVISGINYYPYKIPFKEYMDRVTVFVSHVLPAAMIMGMPMFLIKRS